VDGKWVEIDRQLGMVNLFSETINTRMPTSPPIPKLVIFTQSYSTAHKRKN
jgi:hypothetical protein